MSFIHASSLIDPQAKIHETVKIGPFCIVGPNAEIGANTILHSHVVIDGHTVIGEGNQFFQGCSIGAPPQDNSYKGEPTKTVIGNNNVFREYVSIHRGTLKENLVTTIGSNCLFMAYVHAGHDVVIGNNCTFANSTNFAGHVKIGDRVIIGGGTQISQFVTLGRGAYIGGASAIDRDIPVFCTAMGNRVYLKGINIIGMRRQGYSKQEISEVVDFYRSMEASALSPRAFVDHADLMAEYKDNRVVQEMVEQIKKTEIGIAPFNS
ncbi:MAG: acyl-ACP--UDP-N-acetylglucosamine O-acyltransferase [Bacteriovorax sp.]|jgi:UDP-N-acetylglucosamine acyltransferase|nr:acyl-ACP--UDP-N-acetylglucosamine O-acyltransferase [Bacteriovorax sp.]